MKQKLNCILVIDDDEPTNFMSSMLLEEADCTQHIEIAESGQKALEYLSASQKGDSKTTEAAYPELIFLDINMPAMNGWEFLEKFKVVEKKQPPKPVIIMLTTSINPDDELRAKFISMVDSFENKPLTNCMIDRIMKKHFANDRHL